MDKNFRRFLEAVKLAYELTEKHGTQYIYGHVDNSIFVPLHKVESGWLFKLYPGGRKILSIEGQNLLKSWGVDIKEFNA